MWFTARFRTKMYRRETKVNRVVLCVHAIFLYPVTLQMQNQWKKKFYTNISIDLEAGEKLFYSISPLKEGNKE